jgi:LmbE family N-acetylglucosaminyl deacetylase
MEKLDLPEVLAGASVLAISPHPDDIALSCGGLIRHLLALPVELTLVTLFTRSLYAPLADGKALQADEVRKLRQAEDEEYARRVNARHLTLNLDDVSVRYHYDDDEWMVAQPHIEPIFEDLVEQLQGVIAAGNYTTILCPVGIGINRDHYLTREALHKIDVRHLNMLYYEDLPYGSRVGGPMVVRALAQDILKDALEVEIDITASIQQKIEDIQIYRSQIYPDELASVVEYAAQLGVTSRYAERIWAIPLVAP